jgi:hypothetical protein
MIPSHAVRLKSMLRSMTEVILPALDPNNQLAQDQAKILVGNLRLLLDQADRTYEYELVELREYLTLLKALTRILHGGPKTTAEKRSAVATIDAVEPVASLPIPAHKVLCERSKAVKAAVDALTVAANEDAEPASRKQAIDAVLRQAASQNRRERAWFRAAGFDAAVDEIPPLDEVLRLSPTQRSNSED